MNVQNVVQFPAPELQTCWRQDELQSLLALHSVSLERYPGASWSVGRTEVGDPQFYLLGGTPDLDCIMCMTRIGRLYVLEDGAGTLVAEDTRLARIEHVASRMLARRRLSVVAHSLLGLCAFRAVLDQKAELMFAESMEHVSRFAPQFAALV